MAKKEKKIKLQQSLDSFKSGYALVRAAASRQDLEKGIELLNSAISSRPNASKYDRWLRVMCCPCRERGADVGWQCR